MTKEGLTVAGAKWALDHCDTTDEFARVIARVAINTFAGNAKDWPLEYQEAAIALANREGAADEARRPA